MQSILEVQDVSKRFGNFFAVRHANLSLLESSVHGLIGPNGAGKSTLFNICTGFLKPTEGSVRLRGQTVADKGPAWIARNGVGRSFQISAVFDGLSVIDNILVALQRRARLSFAFWKGEKSVSALRERACNLLEQVHLSDTWWDKHTASLPYGRRRMLELATTIATDPSILLLDEPLAGLGQEDVPVIIDLVRELAVGRSVLIVEHNLSAVSQLCDTVSVLDRGMIIANGTYTFVAADPKVRQAYLGDEHG